MTPLVTIHHTSQSSSDLAPVAWCFRVCTNAPMTATMKGSKKKTAVPAWLSFTVGSSCGSPLLSASLLRSTADVGATSDH
jgi:hypothetical protein